MILIYASNSVKFRIGCLIKRDYGLFPHSGVELQGNGGGVPVVTTHTKPKHASLFFLPGAGYVGISPGVCRV